MIDGLKVAIGFNAFEARLIGDQTVRNFNDFMRANKDYKVGPKNMKKSFEYRKQLENKIGQDSILHKPTINTSIEGVYDGKSDVYLIKGTVQHPTVGKAELTYTDSIKKAFEEKKK